MHQKYLNQWSLNPKTGRKGCQKCKQHMPPSAFDTSERAVDGLTSYCRNCRAIGRKPRIPQDVTALVCVLQENGVYYANVMRGSVSLGQGIRVCPVEACEVACRYGKELLRKIPDVRVRITRELELK